MEAVADRDPGLVLDLSASSTEWESGRVIHTG